MKVDHAETRTRRGIFLLPNLLTTCCLFGGFYAIVASIDGNFGRASLAVFVAMIFDGLDGRVARLMGTETAFGKEFDSLADMVAFGLAPAVVCYQWGVERIAEYGAAWWRFGWIAAFFYAAAVAMRLARFNARSATQDKRYFEGLPSPSGAAIVAAFVAIAHEYDVTGLPGLVLAFAITLLAALLMVSKFPYRSFKDRATGERVRYSRLLLVPLAIAFIAVNPALVLFAMFGAYALSGPIGWSWATLRRKPRDGGRADPGSACRRGSGPSSTRSGSRRSCGGSFAPCRPAPAGTSSRRPCATAGSAACARRARRPSSGSATARRASWSSARRPAGKRTGRASRSWDAPGCC